MRHSAAVLCKDKKSLQILEDALEQLGVGLIHCRTQQDALESVMTGRCTTLIVDFELECAEEVIRIASLLSPGQKPALLAIEAREWPGTGQAFHSGASRILYQPLDVDLVKEAIRHGRKTAKDNRRKVARYEVKTLVHVELAGGTLPGVSLDIGEHGMALHAIEAVPMVSNLAFRCVLPGTHVSLQGRADVMWASDDGRAGLFFSQLAPAARKHLEHWLKKQGDHDKNKHAVRDLLPPVDAHVSFATSEEDLAAEAL